MNKEESDIPNKPLPVANDDATPSQPIAVTPVQPTQSTQTANPKTLALSTPTTINSPIPPLSNNTKKSAPSLLKKQHGQLIERADFAGWCQSNKPLCNPHSLSDSTALSGATPNAVRTYLQNLSEDSDVHVRLASAEELQQGDFSAYSREWVAQCPSKNGVPRCDFASYYDPASRQLVQVLSDTVLNGVVFRVVVD